MFRALALVVLAAQVLASRTLLESVRSVEGDCEILLPVRSHQSTRFIFKVIQDQKASVRIQTPYTDASVPLMRTMSHNMSCERMIEVMQRLVERVHPRNEIFRPSRFGHDVASMSFTLRLPYQPEGGICADTHAFNGFIRMSQPVPGSLIIVCGNGSSIRYFDDRGKCLNGFNFRSARTVCDDLELVREGFRDALMIVTSQE